MPGPKPAGADLEDRANGEFVPPEPVATGAKAMLDELVRIATAMASLRVARSCT
jgi:hypothetical protein